jgi:adenosine deaminase
MASAIEDRRWCANWPSAARAGGLPRLERGAGGLYPGWRAIRLRRIADAGVKVTVSTDDPPFFHTTLAHEYQMLADRVRLGRGRVPPDEPLGARCGILRRDEKTRLPKDLT